MNNSRELTIPCAYQGGKHRLAKDIVDIFFKENSIDKNTHFYDLCCGSGAVSIELVNRGVSPANITMVDKSPWGSFWSLIGEGKFNTNVFRSYIDNIPKDITRIKKYAQEISKQPVNDGLSNSEVYKFLILQACSFGSKAIWVKEGNMWHTSNFRNYWTPTEKSNRKSPVNPMMPMPETLFSRVKLIVKLMKGIIGHNSDITDLISVEDNSIVYIDPPYKNTLGYGFDFDIDLFVSNLSLGIKLHEKASKIYVSEGYKMSEHAYLLSSKLDKGGISGERKKFNEEWLNVLN